MQGGELERASTTSEGLPVSPSLGPALGTLDVPQRATPVDPRVIYISALSLLTGITAGLVARLLLWVIHAITHLSFDAPPPADGLQLPLAHPGAWVIAVPVVGAILIGLIARYGSRAVAGHGIPEAMEQVLTNQSRIPPRLTFLKPFSAAISIGTGAPYGAEGPIIATGGALGSLFGQLLSVTAEERKVLLAAGAAAGIAAAFNAPIASVLLAVELLLFEFRPRSLIPVGLACVAAASIHILFEGPEPFFTFGNNLVGMPSQIAVMLYLLIGCVVGVGAVVLTRTVYAIEHFFEHLPIHWMWHPALGAVVVGIIGWRMPETFGSGYYNINRLLANHYTLSFIVALGVLKFLSWTISLGSGTAGGTLAPVFTIGGTLGAVLGYAAHHVFPHAGINVGMAALVGMVGIFAGASRAFLTSVVFAFETTMRPESILPALAGCATAYLVSSLLMRHSIMTLKMERQGIRVPGEYQPDFLDRVLVRQVITGKLVALRADQTLDEARQWIASRVPGSQHHGFAVLNANDHLVGVLTRRDLLEPDASGDEPLEELITRPPKVVYDDCTLRQAADHMVNHDIGRLPVIDRKNPSRVIGIVTRSDLLAAHRVRIRDTSEARPTLKLSELDPRRKWFRPAKRKQEHCVPGETVRTK
ncbi:MAG TPA: chloride channel protein [Tepidisphaeraceae bacterium]|jgi:H+/Cl- antiporter ClcA|nr:chloride channel protein [Tepidisphaeraceae bacterium]